MQVISYNLVKPYLVFVNFTGCISDTVEKLGIKYELKLKGTSTNEEFWQRKVHIYFNDIHCITSVTTASIATYKHYQSILDNLNNRPIGANLLFHKDYKWQEQAKEVYFNLDANNRLRLIKHNHYSNEEHCIWIKNTFLANLAQFSL